MRDIRIIMHERRGNALTKQKMNDDYEFPFTLNPNIGCLFACNYCFRQQDPFNRHAEFGTEVKVKTWVPDRLDRELSRYRDLPQHLKRVQVGVTSENFMPEVLVRTRRQLNRDIMREILETFERHWNQGNRWMVHILTKSHLVGRYLDVLARMRHMVQVEMTLICLDGYESPLFFSSQPVRERFYKCTTSLRFSSVDFPTNFHLSVFVFQWKIY